VYNPDIRQEITDKNTGKSRLTINLPPLAGLILK
jgi:hypothetical protein